MNTLETIAARRSIRKFSGQPVEREKITAALEAAILAPSAKNGQTWRFIVFEGEAKARMVSAMQEGIANTSHGNLPTEARGPLLADASNSARIMAQAPVVVFVINTRGNPLDQPIPPALRVLELMNVQSISAAIQNLILAAADLGLGSLWIGNIFFAYQELNALLELGPYEEMMAAVALGYAAENPAPRPRKPLDTLVQWRE